MIITSEDQKASTLLKIFGGIVILFAAIFLLIALISISNQNSLINLIDQNFRGNQNYYFYFMPFLLLIGLSYLILGIRLPKLKANALLSHIVISISLIIWIICWVFYKKEALETSAELTGSTGSMTDSIYLIPFLIIIILIPQIIIGSKLYKLEKVHNAT